MRYAKLLLLAFAVLLVPASAATPHFDGFVVAKGDGTVVRGTGYTVFHISAGKYEVDTIPLDVHPCTYIITAGSGDATLPPPSIATAVGRRENHTAVMVATYDAQGNYADEGFHLIVRCNNNTPDGAATVDPDGSMVRSRFVTSTARTGVGAYTVTFNNSSLSTTCAYTASIGLSGTSGISDPGLVNVAAVSGGTIAVRTYDTHGEAADRGFHVFAACNL